MVAHEERQRLRDLTAKWMEFARLPVMKERKRLWKAVKDLRAERPVILVETCMLDDYIGKSELINSDPFLRNTEKTLCEILRHAEEIGDDIVIEPYYRIEWVVGISDYGVPVKAHHAINSSGSDLGYSFNFPIQAPEDIVKLKPRTLNVDRMETIRRKELLDDIFGDILPVKIGGYDVFDQDPGYNPWLGILYCGLTMDIFKLIGNNNLLYWVYDEPDTIHKLMSFISGQRTAFFKWLEKEGLLYSNTDTWNPCPGSYGYVGDLSQKNSEDGNVRLADCWGWIDSQETTPISPKMLNEFFLPYMAEVSKLFGLMYYGCCEGLHDRFEFVEKMIPNLRAVSVSGWSDLFKMGEMLGRKYVYSRKPTPAYISADYPDWMLLEKDMRDTVKAARDCNLEICFRDIYTINGDRKRLSRWVEMTRNLIG